MHVNRQIKFDNGRRKTQQVTADARKNVTALSEQNSRVKKSLPIDIRKLLYLVHTLPYRHRVRTGTVPGSIDR